MNEKKETDFNNNTLTVLKTEKNANQLLSFIDFVSTKTFSVGEFDIEKIAAERFKNKKPDWFEKIKTEISKSSDLSYTRDCLERLGKIIDEADLVKVEIPFKPSEDFINEAYEIIQKAGIGNFLLDIEVNENMQGGAKFSIGGKYLDLTLKKIVLNYLETNDAINRYL